MGNIVDEYPGVLANGPGNLLSGELLDDRRSHSVPRLIIGPDAHRHSFGGWGRKGIVPEDMDLCDLAATFDAQQKAIEKWHFAGVRELVGHIEQINACPAGVTHWKC